MVLTTLTILLLIAVSSQKNFDLYCDSDWNGLPYLGFLFPSNKNNEQDILTCNGECTHCQRKLKEKSRCSNNSLELCKDFWRYELNKWQKEFEELLYEEDMNDNDRQYRKDILREMKTMEKDNKKNIDKFYKASQWNSLI